MPTLTLAATFWTRMGRPLSCMTAWVTIRASRPATQAASCAFERLFALQSATVALRDRRSADAPVR